MFDPGHYRHPFAAIPRLKCGATAMIRRRPAAWPRSGMTDDVSPTDRGKIALPITHVRRWGQRMNAMFHIQHHERIGSTNDEARRLAAAGAPHGTVVHADEQAAGPWTLRPDLVQPAGQPLFVGAAAAGTAAGPQSPN